MVIQKLGIQIEKEKIKLSLFTDNMIVSVENPRVYLLKKAKSEINKTIGYMTNTQKSVILKYWQ